MAGDAAIDGYNAAGHTLLFCAAKSGHVEVVSLLLSFAPRAASPNLRCGSLKEVPLHVATRRNHVGVVRALLDAGADPEVESHTGLDPLAELHAFGWISGCEPVPKLDAAAAGGWEGSDAGADAVATLVARRECTPASALTPTFETNLALGDLLVLSAHIDGLVEVS